LSLGNFTNQATVNDSTQSSCGTPLTSASPCSFTVGEYNFSMANGQAIAYVASTFWTSTSASDLNTLLTTYNNETSGDTSGTLGDWMNSVGFTTAQDKIVLTSQTGKNFDTTTVCFMDTNIAQSDAKQPWCDGVAQSTSNLTKLTDSGSCGTTCYFDDYSQASFTDSSVDSGFYTMTLDVKNDYGISYDWKIKPGWLTDEQGNASFHQFHWLSFAINSSPMGSGWCTAREIGTTRQDNTNPGGILTMCGTDLQTWLDGVLENPNVSFRVQPAKADSVLLSADRNGNDGFNPRLVSGGDTAAHGTERREIQHRPSPASANVIVVAFDDDRVQRFLHAGPVGKTTLVLTIAEDPGDGVKSRGGNGPVGKDQQMVAYPVVDLFFEGNDNTAANERGTGWGVTWNYAVDDAISDDLKDCLVEWTTPVDQWFRGPGVLLPRPDDRLAGTVRFDVTAQLEKGIRAWAIRSGSLQFYSRQGARALFATHLFPLLLLEHPPSERMSAKQ
jgi:hypothetical protein